MKDKQKKYYFVVHDRVFENIFGFMSEEDAQSFINVNKNYYDSVIYKIIEVDFP